MKISSQFDTKVMTLLRIGLTSIVLAFTANICASELQLHTLFSNGAVLQREMSVPVWGWAEPGKEVEVEFAGQKHRATADEKGKWQIRLSALQTSSEGRPLTVRSGSEHLRVEDLVVGDVWFCSGQSNMAMKVGASANPPTNKAVAPVASWIRAEMENADDPMLRSFGASAPGLGPSFDQAVESFSGEWLKSHPDHNGRFSAVAYFFGKELRRETGMPIGLITSAKSGTKIEAWMPPEAFKGDADMEAYYDKYRIEYEAAAAEFDQEKATQQYEAAMKEFNRLGGKKTKGNHRPKPPHHPRHSDQLPSSLFMGKVAPIQPYAIRGALWYQGEKNSKHNTDKYGRNLEALIRGWRERWGQGDFPFYIVQLTNLGPEDERKNDAVSGWVHVQDMQRRTLKVPNTGMAVTNDLGEARNIHPKNKVDVGKRLALWALKNDYGRDLKAWSGPLYQSHETRGGKIQVTFSHSGSGLMTARKHLLNPAKPVDEELNGFEIQAGDGTWAKANARIVSADTIEVWSDQVKEPKQLRYAFVMNPASTNLYNQEGLPASCFTTLKPE